MNIRWLWGNYIGPEWNLSREDVRTVHRLVKERYIHPAVLFGATAVWIVICFAVVDILRRINVQGLPVAWYLSILAGTIAAIIVIALWSFRLIYTRPVRRAMHDIGYDVCIRCGYWLHGLHEEITKCPECGSPRESMPPNATESS